MSGVLQKFDAFVQEAMERLVSENVVERLWQKDPSLWKSDRAHQKSISNRLGWLDTVTSFAKKSEGLRGFADDVRADGYDKVVLLGMGGSSMAPEVFVRTFGPAPGYPDLHVLDSTDPDRISDIESSIDLSKTLFIVATKSGTTIETLSFFEYFWERLNDQGISEPGRHFVAITDAETPLVRLADERGFRRTFINPGDIGGRYSAISYFGLVPAALLGVDLDQFFASAAKEAGNCRIAPKNAEEATMNPGLLLGAFIGGNALAGRDKLTLVFQPELASLGAWIEQLIAESLGKEGKGVVPVDLEGLAGADRYGHDRCFVELALRQQAGTEPQKAMTADLAEAGHPVLATALNDKFCLASEFFRWEFATAVAGVLTQVDPFDEPNVTESKNNTSALLKTYQAEGSLPPAPVSPIKAQDEEALRRFFSEIRAGDYVAINAYLNPDEWTADEIKAIRKEIRDRAKVATTSGWGPRFLHSTGQLHKGGPGTGAFIQLVSGNRRDVGIPGQPFTFGTLKAAQAQGDLTALLSKGRRAIQVDLGDDLRDNLAALHDAVREALGTGIE